MGGKTAVASKQAISEHIKELRNRLFLVAAVFVLASSAAYLVKDTILHILLEPLGHQALTYLTPGGGFSFIFKITMWCGLAVTFPFLVFSLYRFVMPALPAKAQKKSLRVLVSSIALFISGAVFGYIWAIPGALRFLTTFAEEYVTASLTADSYLNFLLAYTVGLGVLFQLPLLLVIINWAKPLKPSKLFSFERYVVLLSFIAAAIVTPTPDVVNQTVIALPIIIMYQIGIVAVMWSNRAIKKTKTKPAVAETLEQSAPVAVVRAAKPNIAKSTQSTPVSLRSQQPTVLSVRQTRPATPVRVPPRRSIDGISLVTRPQN